VRECVTRSYRRKASKSSPWQNSPGMPSERRILASCLAEEPSGDELEGVQEAG
jgi:hypothetical protein